MDAEMLLDVVLEEGSGGGIGHHQAGQAVLRLTVFFEKLWEKTLEKMGSGQAESCSGSMTSCSFSTSSYEQSMNLIGLLEFLCQHQLPHRRSSHNPEEDATPPISAVPIPCFQHRGYVWAKPKTLPLQQYLLRSSGPIAIILHPRVSYEDQTWKVLLASRT